MTSQPGLVGACHAITAYVPAGRADGNFGLAAGFARIDDDRRPISEIPEDELLDGFGR
jgi:hypothetical protein